jgi:ubiquinone/menaquinone biosynthesis C-methylase UbiE
VNYKLLFPTYRGRQRWVLQTLDRVKRVTEIARLINVGCGEGDIDCNLREYSGHLVSLDVNQQDIMHARALNADTAGIRYIVADADYLPFDGATFDVACCLEVIEHVADPRACLRELARVVRFGGYVLVTCPSARFPLTYDPVNWVLSRIGTHISVGAFGYGHSWLVYEEELTRWAGDAGLELLDSAYISKALAAIVEAYWPSLIQSIAKANAENRGADGAKPHSRARLRPAIRPTRESPRLCAVTDALITADDRLFSSRRSSVSLGFLFQKEH